MKALSLAISSALVLTACSNAEPQEARWTDYAAAVAGLVRAELARPPNECRRDDIDPVWSAAAERMNEKDRRARSGVSAEEWRRLDAENAAELASLLDTRGWPDPCALTRAGALGVFYVVQHHRDAALRQEALPYLEAMAEAGRLRRSDLALLVDRVLTDQDRPQRFGTQYHCDRTTGRYVRMETEDPSQLDARRRSMTLMAADIELRLVNAPDDGRCAESDA